MRKGERVRDRLGLIQTGYMDTRCMSVNKREGLTSAISKVDSTGPREKEKARKDWERLDGLFGESKKV